MSTRAAAGNDRLVTTLFFATLFHGLVIMGVSFQVGAPPEASTNPTLEVVLVRSDHEVEVAPDDANYFAERNQTGGGNTPDPLPPEARVTTGDRFDNPGQEDGNLPRPEQREDEIRPLNLVASRSLSADSLTSLRVANEMQHLERVIPELMRASESAPDLVSEYTERNIVQSSDSRELFVSVNTRESRVARYLALWKKRIEQVGTLNFPDAAVRAGLSGSPTLEVAIRANGDLHEIILRTTSGHAVLDQAATRIVRLSSPFDPFPDEIRKDFDVLRFVYEWQFIRGAGAESRVSTDEP